MSTLEHEIVAFDYDAHAAFVFSSWSQRPLLPDGSKGRANNPRWVLEKALHLGHVRVAVAHVLTDADTYLGWAAVEPAVAVVGAGPVPNPPVWWVYVRPNDNPPTRRRGIARSLLTALGVDCAQPIVARFWSPFATLISERHAIRLEELKHVEGKASEVPERGPLHRGDQVVHR